MKNTRRQTSNLCGRLFIKNQKEFNYQMLSDDLGFDDRWEN